MGSRQRGPWVSLGMQWGSRAVTVRRGAGAHTWKITSSHGADRVTIRTQWPGGSLQTLGCGVGCEPRGRARVRHRGGSGPRGLRATVLAPADALVVGCRVPHRVSSRIRSENIIIGDWTGSDDNIELY